MNPLSRKQNRRQFFISVARNIIIGGLGVLGIHLGYTSLTSDGESQCEVKLPCRNCFKLGNCGEDKAAKMRSDLKQSNQSVRLKNVKENG
jgi:hypothetical protein